MDPDHPDLADLSQRLQRRLDAVLEAEHRAAAVAARRTSTLRDRLLEVEDRATAVVVWTVGDGQFLPVAPMRVHATGTTASGLIALW